MEGSAGGGAGQKGPSRRSFGPQRQQQGGAMMRAPPGAAAAAAHAHAQAHAQAQGMMGPVMGPHGNATHPQQVPVVLKAWRGALKRMGVRVLDGRRVWAGGNPWHRCGIDSHSNTESA